MGWQPPHVTIDRITAVWVTRYPRYLAGDYALVNFKHYFMNLIVHFVSKTAYIWIVAKTLFIEILTTLIPPTYLHNILQKL